MLNIAFMAMPAKLRSCSAAIAAARRPKVCVSRAGLARTTEKDSMSFSAAIAAAVGYEQAPDNHLKKHIGKDVFYE